MQLEAQIDPETGEPLLKPIAVELLGEGDDEAIRLPLYLKSAYDTGEESRQAGRAPEQLGFLRTLLLRRVGSTIQAGMITAARMLGDWATIEPSEEEDEPADETPTTRRPPPQRRKRSPWTNAPCWSASSRPFRQTGSATRKWRSVIECLRDRGWLERGCIIFSQYRDSIRWLAEQLTTEFPAEPIALYSGSTTSGIMRGGGGRLSSREDLKQRSAAASCG